MNGKQMTLNVRRIDVCDLLLACLAAKEMASDEGGKWIRLHDELKRQLKEFDKQNDI